jgi:hypothetical protein
MGPSAYDPECLHSMFDDFSNFSRIDLETGHTKISFA